MTATEQLNERLWHAAATNDTRTAAEAIIAGAKIDTKLMYKAVSPDANPWNPSGGRLTPLSVAAYHGHVEMVRLLLQNGADPTLINDWGQSIINFCKGPEVAIILQEALRERGANKDSALYLSPKALPSSPPNVVVTEADSPRRQLAANAGNLSPARAGAASPLRTSAQGSLLPRASANAALRKSSSPAKKRRAALETATTGDVCACCVLAMQSHSRAFASIAGRYKHDSTRCMGSEQATESGGG